MGVRLAVVIIASVLLLAAVALILQEPAGEADGDRSGPRGGGEVACDAEARPGGAADEFVAALEPGDTACFREGTHSAGGTIELSAPDVTLTSYPGERAILAGRLVIARGADGALVEDLTLNGRDGDGPSPTVNANRVVFRGNDVTNDHTGICFVLGDDRYGEADGTVIEGNRIHDCGRLPATNHDHGIYVAHASGTVIRDNLIYANADRGVQLYPDADGTRVTGNVIDGNGQGVIISGNDRLSSDDNVIEQNLITNSMIRHNVESHWPGQVGSRNLVRDNCLHGGARDDGDGGIETPPEGFEAVDNLVADPRYIDREAGDYALEEGSPCSGLGR